MDAIPTFTRGGPAFNNFDLIKSISQAESGIFPSLFPGSNTDEVNHNRRMQSKSSAIVSILLPDCDNLIVSYLVMQNKAGNCHIISFGTTEGFRSQGFGRKVLVSALEHAHGHFKSTSANLVVSVDAVAAISLYSSLGFVEEEFLKSYYSDGSDGIFMAAAVLNGSSSGVFGGGGQKKN